MREPYSVFPCHTFPLASDFDHYQIQDTDLKMELLPDSLVQPLSRSENILSPFFYGSWVAATNKQLLMRIISPQVLKIEKAKYALPESFFAFNFRYFNFGAMLQLSEQEKTHL